MKIGIEAERANNRVKTGVEHYAQQLILQFAEISREKEKGFPFSEKGNPYEHEFILYLRTEPEEWIKQLPKNFSYKVMPFPIFWTQIRLAWEMLWHRPDVLFIPASSMPLIHPRKTVVTVHDLAFMFYPETYTPFMRYFHMFEDVLVSQLAWKIIAVSESTKKDFVRLWKVDERRVTVIHHGYTSMTKIQIPNDKFQINSNNQNSNANNHKAIDFEFGSRDKLGMTQGINLNLPEKFVLFLSTLQPRKNLEGLIEAFKLFKQEHPDDPHKLVVAGKVGWKAEGILEKIEKNIDVVVYLSHVSDADRAILYQKASALCVPSFYEGFGMWILEAFDAGVPVVTSNVSSMPEVCGDACEYCNPKSVESIKKAMEQVLLHPPHAEELVRRGADRLKEFSWRKCAEETLGTF